MKIILIIILYLHTFIHLMGFLKAFSLAQISELPEISKTSGILWLTCFLLMLLGVTGYAINKGRWEYPLLAAIILSSILIILNWSAARWGMIPNVILLFIALTSLSSNLFSKETQRVENQILEENTKGPGNIITREDLDSIPVPVAKWLERSGIVGKACPSSVVLTQQAEMKL